MTRASSCGRSTAATSYAVLQTWAFLRDVDQLDLQP